MIIEMWKTFSSSSMGDIIFTALWWVIALSMVLYWVFFALDWRPWPKALTRINHNPKKERSVGTWGIVCCTCHLQYPISKYKWLAWLNLWVFRYILCARAYWECPEGKPTNFTVDFLPDQIRKLRREV